MSNEMLTKQDYGTILFALEQYQQELIRDSGAAFPRLYALIAYFQTKEESAK